MASMMRRIVMVLTVAVMLVTMLVAVNANVALAEIPDPADDKVPFGEIPGQNSQGLPAICWGGFQAFTNYLSDEHAQTPGSCPTG